MVRPRLGAQLMRRVDTRQYIQSSLNEKWSPADRPWETSLVTGRSRNLRPNQVGMLRVVGTPSGLSLPNVEESLASFPLSRQSPRSNDSTLRH